MRVTGIGTPHSPGTWLAVAFLVSLAMPPAPVHAGAIRNIKTFLDQCPTDDPRYSFIRSKIQLRRNGVLVGNLACTAPVSSMPVAQYTDELLVVQGLRVMLYMDQERFGYLPWTPDPIFTWFSSRVQGIDIRDGSGSFCCESFDGRTFIAIGSEDDFNRSFDKEWRGISGNIDLYAHEARHVDGFPHSSCCSIANGCDNTFDLANLSPYGVQYILNKYWLDGTINVGVGCLSPTEISDIAQWHLGAANSNFRTRFCTNLPPMLTIPASPGGSCVTTDVPGWRDAVDLLLSQGRPNPLERSTRIDFAVPRTGHVTLRIYDIAGHAVATLVDQELAAGSYSRNWDAGSSSSGAYFCRLESEGRLSSRKLIVVR